ncbi:MAG: aldehyde dehydrogenase family protein [Planctomycetota bacterium]|jgi:acyl-CoA reductase-like NAD-dependent aldehyde dehydrogenase|nr:aldehyde dehydrogenase family protein [Planctomycetota bacterium]
MTTQISAEQRTTININPSTGEELARIPCATQDEVLHAVAVARKAQPAWAALGFDARAQCLLRVAERSENPDVIEHLANLVTAEMGKPLADARREAAGTSGNIRRLAASCAEALAESTTYEDHEAATITREPLGVVAAITPWNFPLGMTREVITPALLAGNTVVFKPSEIVPLSGAALYELFEAELPKGVISLVQGDESTGKALVSSSVDMVGFVGSVEAGRHIMSACGADLKRMVLELGGKDPMIVCADADLEKAASFAVRESMRNTGQVCCSVERIYVEQEIVEPFTDLVVEKTKELLVGDGKEDVFMGPMASKNQLQNVLGQIEDARSKGARVLLGGGSKEGPGWFMQPTVVTDVADDMDLMRRETFGPVATIRTVDSADEAVLLANESEFGLGASVWTGDVKRGRMLAARLESGQVGVNHGLGGAGDTPWAGAKQSGFGFLGSPDGYRQFTRPRSIFWTEEPA